MSSYLAEKMKTRIADVQAQAAAHLGEASEVEFLREAFGRAIQDILSLEDEGWTLIGGMVSPETKGLSLEDVKKVTKYAERQTKLNHLLGRGLRLKNNYVFGRGFMFERVDGKAIEPRFRAIIDDPENQEVLFSPTAIKELNRVAFTAGNLLLTYDTKEKKFERLSIDLNVENYLAHDSSPGRIKYYLRTYEIRNDLSQGSQPDVFKEWVPVSTYALANKGKLPRSIKVGETSIPVSQTKMVIDLRLNKDNGEVWGVPDCMSALPWAWASSEYLKDGSKLAKSIAAIAYHVRAKTLEAAKSASAQIQRGPVGRAAVTGPDTELVQMPRAGAIDMYEGRPLQAAVASALDVSVAAITSDTAKGGSYASEASLSQPEQLAALSRQEDFAGFFERIFAAMGATGIRINFARIDLDPIHRRAQSLALFRTLGGINQEEYRNAAIELMDIRPTTPDMPEPDEFTGSKAATLTDFLQSDRDGSSDNPIPSRGNSGAVGSLDDSGNDARDSDDAATA